MRSSQRQPKKGDFRHAFEVAGFFAQQLDETANHGHAHRIMPKRRSTSELAEVADIRLGWVRRFYTVACRQSIAAAAADCQVHPTTLSSSVQQLELALRLPLLMPATSQMFVLGKYFVPHAQKIIGLAGSISQSFDDVTVSGLQSLIAVSEHESYVAAAQSMGWTRDKIMRGITNVEDWAGPVACRTTVGIRLSGNGLNTLPIAKEIVEILNRSRGLQGDARAWANRRRRVKPWWLRTYGA